MVDTDRILADMRKLPKDEQWGFVKGLLSSIEDSTDRDRASSFLSIGMQLGPEPIRCHVVLLVHGIRTRSEWQDRVRVRLEKFSGVKAYAIGFGYFDALSFWLPIFTRRRPIRTVLSAYRNAREENPGADISAVCHSFGTYVMCAILAREGDVSLNRLILCGSVVKEGFSWAKIARRPKAVVNDVGTQDYLPVLATVVSWGYGPTGLFGFKELLVRDRFHNLGHSGFFSDSHIEQFWVPFVIDGQVAPSSWDAERPVAPWCLSVAPRIPIKLILFCLAILLWYLLT